MATECAVTKVVENSVIEISVLEFNHLARALYSRQLARHLPISPALPTGVFGIPKGGVPVAIEVAHLFGIEVLAQPCPGCLIVDDIVDSGATLERFRIEWEGQGCTVDALLRKAHSPKHLAKGAKEISQWVHFWWEEDSGNPEDAVVRLLEYIGENPTRDGLLETPQRVVRAWKEMCCGYGVDPSIALSKTFEQDCDEMIVLRNIQFYSTCEHHMLPFSGVAHVAYLSQGRVVGISKIARTVECFARRLQIQERLTTQITEAIQKALNPLGVGCVIEAQHLCMGCRGIRNPSSRMVTSSLLGQFKENALARQEFLSLCGQRVTLST